MRQIKVQVFIRIVCLALLASIYSQYSFAESNIFKVGEYKYEIPLEFLFRGNGVSNIADTGNFDPEGPLFILFAPNESIVEKIPKYNLTQGELNCCNTTFSVQAWVSESNITWQDKYDSLRDFEKGNISISSINGLYKIRGKFENFWIYSSINPNSKETSNNEIIGFFARCGIILKNKVEQCSFHVNRDGMDYRLTISHNNIQYYKQLIEYLFSKLDQWKS